MAEVAFGQTAFKVARGRGTSDGRRCEGRDGNLEGVREGCRKSGAVGQRGYHIPWVEQRVILEDRGERHPLIAGRRSG